MKKNQIILSIFPFVGCFFYGLHAYTLNRRNFSKVFISWVFACLFAILIMLLTSLLPNNFFKDQNVFIGYIIILGILFNIVFCLTYNFFDNKEKQNNKNRKHKK